MRYLVPVEVAMPWLLAYAMIGTLMAVVVGQRGREQGCPLDRLDLALLGLLWPVVVILLVANLLASDEEEES